LVETVFSPKSFDVDFKLVPGISDGPVLPENSTLDTCLEWIARLPSYTPPTWIGLDLTAEVERQQRVADGVVTKVALIQEKCDGDSS
jgi:hypothetical protein